MAEVAGVRDTGSRNVAIRPGTGVMRHILDRVPDQVAMVVVGCISPTDAEMKAFWTRVQFSPGPPKGSKSRRTGLLLGVCDVSQYAGGSGTRYN